MEVINQSELHSFSRKHPNARKPLAQWLDIVTHALWNNFADVRQSFRSADYVKEQVIFDIGGNNYRLIASVDYVNKRMYVLNVMTHADYDRWKA
jgi:mRNA interferase HigB